MQLFPRRPHFDQAPGITRLRLGLAAAGLVLWGYGVRADINWLRWVGIGYFAVAVALRFWGRRPPADKDDEPPGAS
jgi:hypothetical protein